MNPVSSQQPIQQSIMPKKPLTDGSIKRESHIGPISFLVGLIFVGSVALAGGSWFMTKTAQKKLDAQTQLINSKLGNYETFTKEITELKSLDKKMRVGDKIVLNHFMVSPIFSILQSSTLKNVKYSKFSSASLDTNSKMVIVKASGSANSYEEIAQQSDALLACNTESIKNPVFSNLETDEKGRVNFDLEFSVDYNILSFDKNFNKVGTADYPCNQSTL